MSAEQNLQTPEPQLQQQQQSPSITSPTGTPNLPPTASNQSNTQQSPRRYNSNNNRSNRQNNRNKNQGNNNNNSNGPRKRKAILDLTKYTNQKMAISLIGGREITGILKGFDTLLNLVLDETVEVIRDSDGKLPPVKEGSDDTTSGNQRKLGLVVVRGPLLLTISPCEGFEIIENPFVENVSAGGEEAVI
ncbi:unnamed protein product [Ambrosiozyma monospora]|uniref:Unnamed protein product n=1 Tax=Ambrosiozyma monospora TaxID=43982 RepID=A0ACB5TA84_AMBMO|nr:unnamed protein product [Ambrosiozyma monospora]